MELQKFGDDSYSHIRIRNLLNPLALSLSMRSVGFVDGGLSATSSQESAGGVPQTGDGQAVVALAQTEPAAEAEGGEAAKGPTRPSSKGAARPPPAAAKPASRKKAGPSDGQTGAPPAKKAKAMAPEKQLLLNAKTALATYQTISMQVSHIMHGVDAGDAAWSWAKVNGGSDEYFLSD